MRFFLDFDGVIFNTQALKEKMAALGIEEGERSEATLRLVEERDPSFSLQALVFPDAAAFLARNSERCEIVSSYVSTNPDARADAEDARAYQTLKIRLAGVTSILGEDRVHVVGERKRDVLAELARTCAEAGEECVFIDDRIVHIDEARELGIRALLMDRTGAIGDASERIRSFAELAELHHA
jgi:hypothetical protein